jgi:hypothetical protein
MKLIFNPTGTHEHKGQLKGRIDLYPESQEKSYAQNYVYVPVVPESGYPGLKDEQGQPLSQKDFDLWIAGLPHIWQLNPCLSIFVDVDENTTLELFNEFIQDIYKPDVLATIDNIMSAPLTDNPHLHAHLISPYARGKTTLSGRQTASFNATAKNYINQRLGEVSLLLPANGKAKFVTVQSIAVGSTASDRATSLNYGNTIILKTNPANASGTLDTWELWFDTAGNNATGVKVGSFTLISGANFTTNDYESIGNVTKGSKQTFTGLSTSVTSGDYAGYYGSEGLIERDSTGYSGVWLKSGDYIPCTNTEIPFYAAITISVYATGTEVSTPTVTTQAVSSIADTTATGNGNITDDGGATATRGMCWNTTGTPVITDSHATNGTGEGAYTVAMTSLDADTLYYVRAYATNSAGTS